MPTHIKRYIGKGDWMNIHLVQVQISLLSFPLFAFLHTESEMPIYDGLVRTDICYDKSPPDRV